MFPGDADTLGVDRPAIVMTGSGATRTWGELNDRSLRLANYWHDRGLVVGAHVAMLMENVIEFAEVCWAAERSGLYYTPINSHLTPSEVAYIVENSGARAVVTTARLWPVLREALAAVSAEIDVLCVGDVEGAASYEDALASTDTVVRFTETAGQTMLYSSGTTGVPKGVWRPLSGREPGDVVGIGLAIQMLWGGSPDMRYLSTAPLYHSAPMSFLLGTHRCGGTVYVMEKFDATAACLALEKYEITHSQWVPTMLSRMTQLDEAFRRQLRLDAHRFAIHGAAPCPVPLKRAVLDWWGPILWEYYAGTEGPGSTVISPTEWLEHPGSVGRASAGTLHIVGEDGEELPAGEVGTVYFESVAATTFRYHGDDDKTASVRTSNGWSTMGDIGYLDTDGYLYLTDRKAFTIISGGVNVYPQEAENVLVGHPDIRDVAVFGIPDRDLGEVAHAVVQLRDGVEASREVANEILTFCRRHLSSMKCPRTLSFVGSLHRAETGKLSKAQLREDYLASLAAQ